MLIAQTSRGPARIEGPQILLLDVGERTLGDLVVDGRLNDLRTAEVVEQIDKSEVSFMSPVNRPGKFLIVGLNYKDHAEEIGAQPPTGVRFSYGPGSAIAGPDSAIVLPAIAPNQVDYEGEVAVVIGSAATCVSKDEAWRHVAGLTVANDVSARDVQLGRHPRSQGVNVGLGKGFPTFKPLGPAMLVTGDRGPGTDFTVTTRVDGEIRQSSSTAAMFFDIPTIVAVVSQFCRLDAGDVILTGTPGGVAESDANYLKAGQLVEVEVDGIGTLRNRVVTAA